MRFLLLACLATLSPVRLSAQSVTQEAYQGAAVVCADKAPMMAVSQALAVNIVINRFDAWVKKEHWARTSFRSWSRNLDLGWEWDENDLHTNMFYHPYHGSLYFSAARASCLTFWESVPVTMLGSWTWEYFGETWRPSLNDFFMTTFGGPALGEALHRLAWGIRDTKTVGRERLGREVAALLIDPMGGLNRLIRGQWDDVEPNPAGYELGLYFYRVSAGARGVRTDGADGELFPAIGAEVTFGDPFEVEHRSPFDVFSLRAHVTRGSWGPNILSVNGRIYGKELTPPEARHRHQLVVNQHYDYFDNPVHRFGEQAVQVGLLTDWGLGFGGFVVRTLASVDFIPLGAIDAPYDGIGERVYEFGPGLGGVAELALRHGGVTYASAFGRFRYLHTVSGARAEHAVRVSGLEVTLPIAGRLGIGAYLNDLHRHSDYRGGPIDERAYLEGGVHLTWTGVSGFDDGPAAP